MLCSPSSSNFMRWAKLRSMFTRYRQTPVKQTDRTTLRKHSFVKEWEEAVLYLLRYNPGYEPLYGNI